MFIIIRTSLLDQEISDKSFGATECRKTNNQRSARRVNQSLTNQQNLNPSKTKTKAQVIA